MEPWAEDAVSLAAGCVIVSVPLFWFDWYKSGEMILLSIIGITLSLRRSAFYSGVSAQWTISESAGRLR